MNQGLEIVLFLLCVLIKRHIVKLRAMHTRMKSSLIMFEEIVNKNII